MPVEWSASRRRYVRNGRAVPEKEIRKTVQQAIDSGKAKIRDTARSLLSGKIDNADFAVQMREQIRAAHRAVAMIANGGKLDNAAAGRLGAALRQQYKFLDLFTNGIDGGDVALNAKVAARAQQYIQAAYNTYNNAVTAMEIAAGVQMGRWRLSIAEHCAGCLSQAARGAQRLTAFPPLGSQNCRVNCKCWIEPITKA